MNSNYDCGKQFEAQAWLWQHKVALFVLGLLVLIGLLVSGSGV